MLRGPWAMGHGRWEGAGWHVEKEASADHVGEGESNSKPFLRARFCHVFESAHSAHFGNVRAAHFPHTRPLHCVCKANIPRTFRTFRPYAHFSWHTAHSRTFGQKCADVRSAHPHIRTSFWHTAHPRTHRIFPHIPHIGFASLAMSQTGSPQDFLQKPIQECKTHSEMQNPFRNGCTPFAPYRMRPADPECESTHFEMRVPFRNYLVLP